MCAVRAVLELPAWQARYQERGSGRRAQISSEAPHASAGCVPLLRNLEPCGELRQDILLVLDGAPNHRCGDLAVPDYISLLYLPPYSPELNPKENLWDEIREKYSRTMQSNPWTPCVPSSSRLSSTSSVTPSSSAPSPLYSTSSTHSDVEVVLEQERE